MNWSSHYHNLLWVFLLLCAGSFWLLPSSSEEIQDEIIEQEAMVITSSKKKLKHGRFESKDSNGKLKAVVNYEHGQKHGTSYLYYPNGKVHLEMTYDHNQRQGASLKYYKTGELYAKTPYVNNKIEGIRETYYESGSVLATIPYRNSWPGTGLKEYNKNGEERRIITSIDIKKEGKVWHLKAVEPCRKQQFYLGNLVDGQFLDKNIVMFIDSDGEGGVLDLTGFNSTKSLKSLEIICKCTTMQNNPLILTRTL